MYFLKVIGLIVVNANDDFDMKEKEIEILEYLLDKTGLMVYPINKISIINFIYGFEAGIGHNTFTSELKEYLEGKYDIYGSNPGWPRQVQLYAEKNNLEWSEAFIKIGKTIIGRIKTIQKT